MAEQPPLSGIRVIDLTRLLPGPFCTMYLADLGAEVIKVEPPQGGDYARSLSPELFAVVNRNKQSLALDVRSDEGRETLLKLVASADVLIESFRPGVMQRLGIDYDQLKAVRPSLVYCSLTGYGQTGPYVNAPGHDLNYCGVAGTQDQIGPSGGAPAMLNLQIADLAGGALTAATGLLAALVRAKSSGIGAHVDISMTDGTLALNVAALATLRATGDTLPRGEDMLSGGLPNYSIYRCADDRYVTLGALEPKFFQAFCEAVERPDLAKIPYGPGEAGETLRERLTELFASEPRQHWLSMTDGSDACLGPVLTLAEALENEQLLAREMVLEIDGRPQLACPVRLAGEPRTTARPAPALGADNDAILATLA